MKRLLWMPAAAICLFLARPAFADLALATASKCMSCHTVEKKRVGPAFKDVAAKYRGDNAAADRLAAKIIHGGADAWGPVPMPANTQVSPADAKKLATWILGLK